MNIRRHDLSEWTAHTRRYDTLEHAIEATVPHEDNSTKPISIWQIAGHWMVVTWTRAWAN